MEVLSQKPEADKSRLPAQPSGAAWRPRAPTPPRPTGPLAAALGTAIPAPPHPLSRLLAPGPSVWPSVPPPALHGRPSFSPLASISPRPRTHLVLPGTVSPSHNRTRPRQQQRTVGPQNVCSVSIPRTHSASPGCTRPQKGPRLPTGLRRKKETAVNGRGSGVCPTPRLRDQGPSSPTTHSLPLGESSSLGAHIGSLLARPPG